MEFVTNCILWGLTLTPAVCYNGYRHTEQHPPPRTTHRKGNRTFPTSTQLHKGHTHIMAVAIKLASESIFGDDSINVNKLTEQLSDATYKKVEKQATRVTNKLKLSLGDPETLDASDIVDLMSESWFSIYDQGVHTVEYAPLGSLIRAVANDGAQFDVIPTKVVSVLLNTDNFGLLQEDTKGELNPLYQLPQIVVDEDLYLGDQEVDVVRVVSGRHRVCAIYLALSLMEVDQTRILEFDVPVTIVPARSEIVITANQSRSVTSQEKAVIGVGAIGSDPRSNTEILQALRSGNLPGTPDTQLKRAMRLIFINSVRQAYGDTKPFTPSALGDMIHIAATNYAKHLKCAKLDRRQGEALDAFISFAVENLNVLVAYAHQKGITNLSREIKLLALHLLDLYAKADRSEFPLAKKKQPKEKKSGTVKTRKVDPAKLADPNLSMDDDIFGDTQEDLYEDADADLYADEDEDE